MRSRLPLRLAAAAFALAVSAGSAAAHQVWIEQEGGRASFYFGEFAARSGWVQTRKTEDDGIFSIVLPWQGSYVTEAKHTDNAAGKRTEAGHDGRHRNHPRP